MELHRISKILKVGKMEQVKTWTLLWQIL